MISKSVALGHINRAFCLNQDVKIAKFTHFTLGITFAYIKFREK